MVWCVIQLILAHFGIFDQLWCDIFCRSSFQLECEGSAFSTTLVPKVSSPLPITTGPDRVAVIKPALHVWLAHEIFRRTCAFRWMLLSFCYGVVFIYMYLYSSCFSEWFLETKTLRIIHYWIGNVCLSYLSIVVMNYLVFAKMATYTDTYIYHRKQNKPNIIFFVIKCDNLQASLWRVLLILFGRNLR